MLYYMFLRLFYGIYFLTLAYLILKAVSSVLFKRGNRIGELKRLPGRALFALLWPLSLLTRAGRKKLVKTIN